MYPVKNVEAYDDVMLHDFFLASFKKMEVDKFVPVLALLCRMSTTFYVPPYTEQRYLKLYSRGLTLLLLVHQTIFVIQW